jgi:hypothetical protein
MTKFKTSDRDDQSTRLLDDAELDAVVGGALDNCLPSPFVTLGPGRSGEWTFRDVFAKPTLGTYH